MRLGEYLSTSSTRDIGAKVGLAGRDQHRIVIHHTVHRASSQAGNQAEQSISAIDAGRPAKFIIAERHAGTRWKKVLADLLAHDLLDHDSHLFMNIQKTTLRAVLGGIGTEDRGIHFGDSIHQRGQAIFFRSLIAQEQALVLARKR